MGAIGILLFFMIVVFYGFYKFGIRGGCLFLIGGAIGFLLKICFWE